MEIERRKAESQLRRERANEKTLSDTGPLEGAEKSDGAVGKGAQVQSCPGTRSSPIEDAKAGSPRPESNNADAETLSGDTIEKGAVVDDNDANGAVSASGVDATAKSGKKGKRKG